MVGDIVTLRAAFFAPSILLPIADSVRETVAEGFARATDPKGFERRGFLEKALTAIQKSGAALSRRRTGSFLPESHEQALTQRCEASRTARRRGARPRSGRVR